MRRVSEIGLDCTKLSFAHTDCGCALLLVRLMVCVRMLRGAGVRCAGRSQVQSALEKILHP